LWKVAAASALSFLAGYPPTWAVFVMVVGVYSLAGAWRWKAGLGTIASLVFSLLLCAIQFLPAWEVTGLREPELRYGGIRDWDMILSFVLPNYFDFALNVPVLTNLAKDYFYLGVPALFGLPFLIRRRHHFQDLAPSLAVLAASLVIVCNPFDIVWSVIRHSTLLPDIIRAWYFLAGVTLAFAPLTAYAVDHFLAEKGRPMPAWLAPVSMMLMVMRAGHELYRWKHQSFVAGWRSVFDVILTLAIFAAGMYAVRAAEGRWRIGLAAALIVLVGADYKAFGTSKRFDAAAGEAPGYSSKSYPGMGDDVYQQLRANSESRIVVDNDTGPFPDDLRHVGLVTPQGFDPLLTIQLRKIVDTYGHFRTDRLFDIDLTNEAGLRLLGVRYVISSDSSPQDAKMKDNPRYRLLGSTPTFYKVYEYLDAQPPYSWDGQIQPTVWQPEDRAFQVRSAAGGKLALHEQFFPGWRAVTDGKSVAVEPWMGAFQAVTVPPGEHRVEFQYRSRLLGLGGAISLIALVTLIFWGKRGHTTLSRSGTLLTSRKAREGTG
jgi:hypothetical protein